MINRIFNIRTNPPLFNKPVPSLALLNRLALKKIFDGLNYFEEKELEYGINIWTKEVIRKLTLATKEFAKRELKVIINALVENEEGKFDREKENFKRCEIDYRKAYREGL